jgi:hypothetical protein
MLKSVAGVMTQAGLSHVPPAVGAETLSLDFARILADLHERCERDLLERVIRVHLKRLAQSSLPPARRVRVRKVLTYLKDGPDAESSPPQLDRQGALDLLSILAVHHTWDLSGLHLDRDGAGASKEAKSPRESFGARHTRLPMSAFVIEYDNKPAASAPYSSKILGYSVRLVGLAGSATTSQSGAWESIPECDYFEACCRQLRKKVDEGAELRQDAEAVAYRFYAFITDAIQKALQPNGSTKEGKARVYFITYPVIGYGFQHFLNIFVRPKNGRAVGGSAEEEAKNLWLEWRHHVHGNRNPEAKPSAYSASFTMFKESLRELITDIRMKVFQWHTRQELLESQLGTIDEGADCLGKNIHHILFMNHIHMKNKKAPGDASCDFVDDGGGRTVMCYGYEKDRNCEVFFRWKREGHEDPWPNAGARNRIVLEHSGRIVGCACAIWDPDFAGVQQQLFLQTSRLRLVRSYEWLTHRVELLRFALNLPRRGTRSSSLGSGGT